MCCDQFRISHRINILHYIQVTSNNTGSNFLPNFMTVTYQKILSKMNRTKNSYLCRYFSWILFNKIGCKCLVMAFLKIVCVVLFTAFFSRMHKLFVCNTWIYYKIILLYSHSDSLRNLPNLCLKLNHEISRYADSNAHLQTNADISLGHGLSSCLPLICIK